METKANYVAVGVFVLVGLAGLVIALLWLAGSQYTEEFAYYRTYFSGSVSGLGKGTLVRYNGIQVGNVYKLEFDLNDPKRVIVTLQVNPDLRIHSDSVASIASEGLTGGSYVEIDGGSQSAPVLPRTMFGEYPVIRSKQSTLQQLEQSAPELVAKLNRIADRLNDVLSDKNRQSISQTLANLRRDRSAIAASVRYRKDSRQCRHRLQRPQHRYRRSAQCAHPCRADGSEDRPARRLVRQALRRSRYAGQRRAHRPAYG